MYDAYWINWNSTLSRYQDDGFGNLTWAYNNYQAREYFVFNDY